ncbi:MAG: hypothetical protein M5U34_05210 [Chloroflexi bacterium]|nr:hypothetical protein [Chloroflexota bacterium]
MTLTASGSWPVLLPATGVDRLRSFIDGISQGVVDLYSRDDDTASFIYSGLPDTTHTISATLLSSNHPNASGTQMMVDYFDTWDGSALPAGTYEEDNPLVYRGDRYDAWSVFSEPAASDGRYIRDAFQHESTVWFPFTGDSFTILALANNSGDHAEIVIDGISQGQFNLYNTTPISRPISF